MRGRDTLHERILTGLGKIGPTTVGQLAQHLSEPFGLVLFALERLRDGPKEVRVLPGGLWDLTEESARDSSQQSTK